MLVRNPDLLVAWEKGRILIRELESGKRILSSAELIAFLDRCTRPRRLKTPEGVSSQRDRVALRRLVQRLRELRLLVPAHELTTRRARIGAWNHNLASLQYHLASRDMRYLTNPKGAEAFLAMRLASERRPPSFNRFASKPRRALPKRATSHQAEGLRHVLRARRTVRRFRRTPVSIPVFSEVIRSTWGRTGWLDGGVLGRLATKTSPSAGALHPIECYILAWNVRGLAEGLYHYDVRSDCLRRLRRLDARSAAVKVASSQGWVGEAAFLCVMTAAYERTLWKYQHENAYRVVWMDAGHLAQTFCLMATALGLGPFTTAAIQDSYIEKLIGLDGIKEFPVYLCGAGVPARKLF